MYWIVAMSDNTCVNYETMSPNKQKNKKSKGKKTQCSIPRKVVNCEKVDPWTRKVLEY
jgi:hypothetical protein